MRLIYLSPVPWHSFSQRPHELIRYFHSSTGGEVLWIDPYPTRLPTLRDMWSLRPAMAGMDGNVPNWLSLVRPKALPIEPLPFSRGINRLFWAEIVGMVDKFATDSTVLGIGKPSQLALHLLGKNYWKSSFYDAMDDFPAFYTGWSSIAMARREREMVSRVTTVLTSSSILHNRLKNLASDVRLVLNACASERLPESFRARSPDSAGAPVIGYVGTIAKWFDWELVRSLAAANPHAKFRLIGPIYGQRPTSLPANISIESPLPHAMALKAMTQFDVGLIPFKRTELTSSVDPIKYYEYRAMGLPVVSSAFGEMSLRGESDGVFLVGEKSDMATVIGSAMAIGGSLMTTAQFRRLNSWASRFEQASVFAGGANDIKPGQSDLILSDAVSQ